MIDFKRIKAIDGLRGLSILLVILCHLDVPWFRGGYVGVDVFFAISGYVITGSLYHHFADAKLISGFYERRARRLLPSLLATLLVCYGAFSLIYEAPDFRHLLEVGALAAIGASNFFFSRTTGYFDDSALENPLLHTWSLAVEEQFYILLAVFLFLVRSGGLRDAERIKRILLHFVAGGTLLSLALAVYLSHPNARFSYFQLPTRFWEIGSGSLLFFVSQKISMRGQALGSLFGLGMVLGAAVFFNEATPYPGYHALLPVLGALLLIAGCRDKHLADNLLGNRLMVFFGAISYALYLVHWPVIVFAQTYFVRDLTVADKIAAATLSIALATMLTYGWERLFQKRVWLPTKRGLWTFATAGVALFLIVGTVSLLRPRPTPVLTEVPSPIINKKLFWRISPSLAPDSIGFVNALQIPPLGTDPNNLTSVWGDSHALNLLPNLVPRDERFGLTYKFYICWDTMPLVGVGSTKAIESHNEEVFDILLHDSRIKNVILDANWTGYLEGQRYFGHRQGREPDFYFQGSPATPANAYTIFETQLRAVLTQLSAAGKSVFICTPNPTYPFDVAKGVAEMEKRGRDPNQELSYGLTDYLKVNRRLFDIFDRLTASIPRTYVIPIHLDFFAEGRSIVARNGRSLYQDGHHLNAEGADQIGDRISAFVKTRSAMQDK
jgi:peptidoglycan/LPS O-acetylase OafA/YrhL